MVGVLSLEQTFLRVEIPSLPDKMPDDVIAIQRVKRTELRELVLFEKIGKKPEKKDKEEERSPLEKELKEISDAILEVTEEATLDSVIHDRRFDDYSATERLMYAAAEQQTGSGLDYSSLNYGKVAEPLAVKFDYNQYEQSKEGFISRETISMKEVDEIVHEKALADLSHEASEFLRYSRDESFQYWRIFNMALVRVKYDLAFL